MKRFFMKQGVSWNNKGLVDKEGVEKRATWSLESFTRRYPIQRRFTLSPHQRVMPEVKLMVGTSTGTPRSKERGGQLEAAGSPPSSCPLDSNHDGRRFLSVDGRPRDRYGLSRSSLSELPPAPPQGASRHVRGNGCVSKMT